MLENTYILVAYLLLGVVVQLFVIFWIAAIVTVKTKELNAIRSILLRAAVTDLVYSFYSNYFLCNDQLYPISAVRIIGPAKYLSEAAVPYIEATYLWLSGCILLAINDCSIVRVFVVYQRPKILHHLRSAPGILTSLFLHLLAFLTLLNACLDIFGGSGIEALLSYVTMFNMTHLKDEMNIQHTDVILFANMERAGPVIPVVIFLSFVVATNIVCMVLVILRLRRSVKIMSKATIKVHKQFTFMLVSQVVFPLLFLALPIVVVAGVTFIAKSDIFLHSKVYQHISCTMATCVPLINCSVSFLFIEPYGKYFQRNLQKIPICCATIKKDSMAVTIVNPRINTLP